MEFRKFESLENTYNGKLLHYITEQGLDIDLWMVTEKVDGANFGLYFDGEVLQTASRNQFVDGTFFACQEVVDQLANKVRKLYSTMALSGSGKLMVVYGELYGPNVQGRVNYGPKGFCGFDITIDGVPVDKVNAFSAMLLCDIPVAPLLFVGSYAGALAYDHEFKSKLTPADANPEDANICEGVVIEPVTPGYFASGKRVYLKHKTEAFSERKGPAKIKVEPEVPADVQSFLEAISGYITESRVHSVISKLGEIGKGDFGKVLKLTVQDAIEDFEKETERCVGRQLGSNTSWLLKLLTKEATPVVRTVFLQKL